MTDPQLAGRTFVRILPADGLVHESLSTIDRTFCGASIQHAQTTLDYVVTCRKCKEARADFERLHDA